MESESGRLHYISVLRVCSMLLIVLFHSMCFYTGKWWYLCTDMVALWKLLSPPTVSVGLSTFVFISGFLYGYLYMKRGKYRNVGSFLTNKFRRLIIPYFFWGIIMVSFLPVVHVSWINLCTGIAHLWFLLMLFELFLIILLLNMLGIGELSSKKKDCIVVLLSFILLYIWEKNSSHHHFLGIESTLYYLPAFLVGFYSTKYRLKTDTFLLAFLLFCIGLAILFLFSFLNFQDSSTSYRIPAIIVSISAIELAQHFPISFCESKIFKNLDNSCMGIYIFNQFVVFIILLVPRTNYYLSHHPYIGVFVIFTISLIIPWLLAILFNRIKYASYLLG